MITKIIVFLWYYLFVPDGIKKRWMKNPFPEAREGKLS